MTSIRQGRPWNIADIRMAFILTAVGAGLASIAWWNSSGTAEQDRQVMWTVVSVIGIMALGVGSFSWLVAGRRAVGLKRADVLDRLEAVLPPLTVGSDTTDAQTVLVVKGSQRFHREGCLLARSKDVRRMQNQRGSMNGLRPCEMCQP